MIFVVESRRKIPKNRVMTEFVFYWDQPFQVGWVG